MLTASDFFDKPHKPLSDNGGGKNKINQFNNVAPFNKVNDKSNAGSTQSGSVGIDLSNYLEKLSSSKNPNFSLNTDILSRDKNNSSKPDTDNIFSFPDFFDIDNKRYKQQPEEDKTKKE